MNTIKHILTAASLLFLFGNCNKENADATINISGAGGSTARFTISGNYLYVVDHASLKSFQVTDPQHTVFTSKVDVGVNIETIFPYQDKLFIGSSQSMYIFSLTHPERPERIGKADYTVRMSCDPVIAVDSVAYATLNAQGPCGGSQSILAVYNIKNITAPVSMNALPLTAPFGLGMKGDALYVCEGQGGLKIYDIHNRYAPSYISTISSDAFYDVIPYGNLLIAQVTGGVALYDIGTNPFQPVLKSKILN